MLEGIGHHLGYQHRQGGQARQVEIERFGGDGAGDVGLSRGGQQIAGQQLQVVGHRLISIGGIVQAPVDTRNAFQPRAGLFQGLGRLAVAGQLELLQHEQRGDELDVVGDPVLQLLEHRRLDEFRPKQSAEVGLDDVGHDGPKVEPEGVKPKAEPSRREGLSSKLDADEDLLGLGIKKPSTGSISENPYDNIDYGSLSLNPRTPEPAATKVESQAFKQEEAFSLSKDDLLEDVSFNDVFGHLKTDPVFSPALHGAKEVVKETVKDEKKEEKKEAVNPVIKNQDQIDKVMKELDKDKAVADSVKERKRKKYLSKKHSV